MLEPVVAALAPPGAGTAGSSPAQIQSAVDSASDGATITLANGSYNLGSAISFDNRNGISVVCDCRS